MSTCVIRGTVRIGQGTKLHPAEIILTTGRNRFGRAVKTQQVNWITCTCGGTANGRSLAKATIVSHDPTDATCRS